MQNDNQELKIAAFIDAADAAQARALDAIDALNATRAGLQQAVAQAARASTQEALKSLHGELERAQRAVIDLQRLSLWRAAWQHVMVALVAIIVTLVAVRWYVPSVNDMQALRAEKAQLAASIADLEQRGGKLQISHCGPERRLCVAVYDYAGIYGKAGDYRLSWEKLNQGIQLRQPAMTGERRMAADWHVGWLATLNKTRRQLAARVGGISR